MINLTVVIDNDEAIRKLKELQKVAKSTTSSVVKDSERMDASWQQMKNTLMSLTAGVSFAALAKQVVQIRGEVQQLEVAFETMLGSKQKADTLMTEIIDLAARTPFGLQDVSNGTKMLLAYGSAAEDVTDEIKMLGNIASGLSIPLNDLIYLYGTTRTQGRMFTMDLRQFMGRGIPLAEELAKQFGVTKDKVGELVTAGKVGFDEMNKALMAMTSEGGKFYNLMDKQSQTISGQISNLEDSIYQMFNEIGESSEGVINDLISGASWVVEHYQEILNVLKYIIAAYGSYKAALILVAAAQKALALAETAAGLMKMTKAAGGLAVALRGLTAAAGPIGLVVSIIGVAVTALTSFGNKSKEATKEMGKMEQAAYDEYIEVNRLVGRLQDANTSEDERKKILDKLKVVAPDIVSNLRDESNMTAQLTANLKDYNAEQIRKIQLAGLDDKMTGEMEKVGKAKTEFASAQLDWSNTVAEYNAKRTTQWTPDVNFTSELKGSGVRTSLNDRQKAEIEQQIVKSLDKILTDTNTTDAYKSQAVSDYLSKTHTLGGVQYKVSGIEGYDLKGAISSLDNARENVQQAEQKFDDFVKEDKQLREIIGNVAGDKKEEAETTLTYAEQYASLEEAYNKAYEKVAEINKNKSKYSTQEAQQAREDLEAAEKAFKEVGGTPRDKAQKSADKTAKEQEDRAKDIKETSLRLEREAQQAVIDAMAEGEEKKRKQIELDYQRREDELIKQEEELKKLQGGNLTDEQTAHFGNIRSSYAKGKQTALDAVDSEAKVAWNEYLSEYGTFLERKAAIAEKYDTAIANAEKEGNKALVAQLKQERIAAEAAYLDEVVTFSKAIESYSMEQITATINEMETQVIAKQAELDAMISSDSAEYENAKKALEALKAKIEAAKKQLELLNMPSNEQEERNKKFAKFGSILSDIQNVAYSAGDALSMFNEGLGNGVRFIGQMAGGAITMIQTIQGVTSAASAAGTALSTMEKASIILTAISVGLQLIQGLLQLITFDKEGAEYERLKERYDGLISIWNELIDKKKEYIEMSYGKEANKAAEEALDILEEEEALNRRMAREYLDSRKNRRNLGKGYSDEGIKELQGLGLFRGNVADADFYRNKSLTDNTDWNKILNMSAEELQNLKENASTWWAELDDEYRQYLENIIEGGEKAAEVQQMLYEQHTQMSFDDLYSSFFDAMMDMDATAEEVANNVSEYFFKAMLFNQMGVQYREKLTQWYNDFAEAMKSDGLSEEEKADLERRYKEIVEQGMQERDAIAGVTGYEGDGESQSATTKGFQAMSQETGSELNGRFTAIQGAVEFIKGISTEQLKQTTSINDTLAHIHNDTSLIEKHTRVLGQMGEDIASIKRSLDDGI